MTSALANPAITLAKFLDSLDKEDSLATSRILKRATSRILKRPLLKDVILSDNTVRLSFFKAYKYL